MLEKQVSPEMVQFLDRLDKAQAIAREFPRDLADVDTAERRAGRVDVLLSMLRDELSAPPAPLPAPALTEDAIVAALRGDPNMAGRVIVRFADSLTGSAREKCQASAYEKSAEPIARAALQSLAVALAAASYRG